MLNVPPEVISNLRDLLQNLSLETVPVCIVLQYYPHHNTVCIHLYDECKRSNDSDVCHRLWSILLWIVRAYLLTIKYQVVQFLPIIIISEQFENILLKFLTRGFQFFFFEVLVIDAWSGYFVELLNRLVC